MEFKRITYIASINVIMIMYKGKRMQFTRENPNFDEVKELIRSGDEDAIIKMVDRKELIPDYSKGMFRLSHDNTHIIDAGTNTPVNKVLSEKVIYWAKEGFPFEPLLKFHRKLLNNPSETSENELYAFLEANMIPITNEGNFIAYKKVTTVNGVLMDSHSRTIDNSIGNIVSIPREQVNPDREQTCSYGLHVGAWEYVASFTGDTTVEVEVEPQDVVTVPPDYKQQKMRVCRYKVLGRSEGSQIDQHYVSVDKEKVIDEETGAVDEEKISAKVVIHDFTSMTAQKVKDHIKERYGVEITLDNKNKKAIIKKAYKIIGENNE